MATSIAKANIIAKNLSFKFKNKLISESEYKQACIGLVKHLQSAPLSEKEWDMLHKHTNMKSFSKNVVKNRLIAKTRF